MARRLTTGRTWTPAEDAALLEMFNEGASPKEIAHALGRTLPAVKSRAGRSGISFTARSKRPDLVADRFWDKTDRRGRCWLWLAARDRKGYGKFGVGTLGHDRRVESAHRVAWELTRGPIPGGMYVLHHCDNPWCVNPDHLWLGTRADNAADMVAKGRSTKGRPKLSLRKPLVPCAWCGEDYRARRVASTGRISMTCSCRCAQLVRHRGARCF